MNDKEMTINAIKDRNIDAQRRKLGVDYQDALQAHLYDIPFLFTKINRLTAENEQLRKELITLAQESVKRNIALTKLECEVDRALRAERKDDVK